MYDRLFKHVTPTHADALQHLARLRVLQHRARDALPLLERAHHYWEELAPHSRWASEADEALRQARAATTGV
jgi:hypothetical protein